MSRLLSRMTFVGYGYSPFGEVINYNKRTFVSSFCERNFTVVELYYLERLIRSDWFHREGILSGWWLPLLAVDA